MDEVKSSLKDLRKELMSKRKESMMPVSKLSKASIMAELGKYSSPSPSGRETTKKIEVEVEKLAKTPSKKVEKVEKHIEEAVKEVKKSNPRMKNSEPESDSSEELVVKKPVAKKELKLTGDVSAKPKKPLSQYQELWGKARKSGMSAKDASEYAKKMMA